MEESWLIRVETITVVAGGYRAVPKFLTAMTWRAKSATALIFRTPAKLYIYETLLERLPHDLEDMAAALGPCIQAAHAVVRERHFTLRRHVAPADPPDIGDGVMGGAKRAGRDQGRAGAGEPGDAMDASGLHGLGKGHGRQDGGEAPGQHGRARPGRANEKDVVGRMPASSSAPRAPLGVVAALTAVAQHPEDAKPNRPPRKHATLRSDRAPVPRMTSAAWVSLDGGTPQARTFRESCR
jgi:hypothetical protein